MGVFIFCVFNTSLAIDVSLTWQPNTEPDLAGYNIYYKSGSSALPYSVKIDVGNATAYKIKNLSDEETYYFVVTAYDRANLESDYSNEVRTFNTNNKVYDYSSSETFFVPNEISGTITTSMFTISGICGNCHLLPPPTHIPPETNCSLCHPTPLFGVMPTELYHMNGILDLLGYAKSAARSALSIDLFSPMNDLMVVPDPVRYGFWGFVQLEQRVFNNSMNGMGQLGQHVFNNSMYGMVPYHEFDYLV